MIQWEREEDESTERLLAVCLRERDGCWSRYARRVSRGGSWWVLHGIPAAQVFRDRLSTCGMGWVSSGCQWFFSFLLFFLSMCKHKVEKILQLLDGCGESFSIEYALSCKKSGNVKL
mmetsp:Transcript_29005/g.42954  ORF Transcript_29005/g.42954 Transcript_29005/m.42954 type:complete len:117 (+) Transcript_29005:159-509(+)